MDVGRRLCHADAHADKNTHAYGYDAVYGHRQAINDAISYSDHRTILKPSSTACRNTAAYTIGVWLEHIALDGLPGRGGGCRRFSDPKE